MIFLNIYQISLIKTNVAQFIFNFVLTLANINGIFLKFWRVQIISYMQISWKTNSKYILKK